MSARNGTAERPQSERNGTAPFTASPVGYAPPSSIEAEQAVLACMMLDRRASDKASALLTGADFYRDEHRRLFEIVAGLYRRDISCDTVTLSQAVADLSDPTLVGGAAYVVSVYDSRASAANVEHYAEIVRRKSLARQLLDASLATAAQVQTEAGEDPSALLEEAHRRVYQIAARSGGTSFRPLSEAVMRLHEEMGERIDSPVETLGLSTGFGSVDRYLCGLKPGGYYILAGRPSMGKTAMALAVGRNVAAAGAPVAIYSGEMDDAQLAGRLISAESRVELNALLTGHVKRGEYDRATKSAGDLYALPIRVIDNPDTTVAGLSSACRQMHVESGLGLVIVDYIGLLRGRRDRDSRREEVGEISRDLKRLARDLSVPVLALSQLSRSVESRENKRPVMSDLRESGDLEQDADAVCFLFREAYYKRRETHLTEPDGSDSVEEAEFIVAKHRNGPTGTASVGFVQRFARYQN